MALDFPSPPYDGQIYVDPTSNSKYVYVAAKSTWKSIQHVPVVVSYGFNKANSAYLTANAAFDKANNITRLSNNSNYLTLDSSGVTTFPSGASLTSDAYGSYLTASSSKAINLKSNNSANYVQAADDSIHIFTNNIAYRFDFGLDGGLSFPDSTVQYTAYKSTVFDTANASFAVANAALPNVSNAVFNGNLRVTGILQIGSNTITITNNHIIANDYFRMNTGGHMVAVTDGNLVNAVYALVNVSFNTANASYASANSPAARAPGRSRAPPAGPPATRRP